MRDCTEFTFSVDWPILKSRNYRVNTLSGREVCLFSLKTNTHTLPLILSFEVYCAARGRPALILLMQPNYLCNSKYWPRQSGPTAEVLTMGSNGFGCLLIHSVQEDPLLGLHPFIYTSYLFHTPIQTHLQSLPYVDQIRRLAFNKVYSKTLCV